MSESIAKLATALAKAQGEFPKIHKDKTANVPTKSGANYSYSYVDLATIIESTTPILANNGLAISQLMESTDNRCFMATYLMHSSGEWLKSEYLLPDPGKMKPQEFGSFQTYAKRYSLTALLNVSADEDDDGSKAQDFVTQATRTPPPNYAPNVSTPNTGNPNTFQKSKKYQGMTFDEVGYDDVKSWTEFMEAKGWAKGPDYQNAKAWLDKAKDKEPPYVGQSFNADEELPF